MKRYFLYIFLLIFLVVFLIWARDFSKFFTAKVAPLENSKIELPELNLENLSPTFWEQRVGDLLPEEPVVVGEELSKKEKESSEIREEAEVILTFEPPSPTFQRKAGLGKIQEAIDDISERLDVISREVADLAGESQPDSQELLDGSQEPEEFQPQVEEFEKPEGRKEEKEEKAEQKEKEKERRRTSGGGAPPSYPKVLISEIQITGEDNEKEEFVELYNPNEIEIKLDSWYLQKKTKGGSDYSSFAPNTLFADKKINKKAHFLIARQDSSFTNLADVITAYPLAEDNTLVLKNPNREIVDKVGWGEAQDFEGSAAENPLAGTSLGREWSEADGNYIDTDNNRADFAIQTPTPKAENSQPAPVQPILEVSPKSLEFRAIEFGSEPQSQTLTISNIGSGELEWLGMVNYTSPSVDGVGWLRLEPDSGTASSQISVSPMTSNLTASSYLAKIIITAVGAEGSPKEVEIILNVEQFIPEEKPSQIVVINEIAWMGTEASSADEWIELYNTTSGPIELLDWQLIFYTSSGAEPRITTFNSSLETTTPTIDGVSYFLLERTDDETISDIEADYIFEGALNNSGGILKLRNANSNLIDEVDCTNGWFAGENKKEGDRWIRISMERKNPKNSGNNSDNWDDNNGILKNGLDADGNSINGTPRFQNNVY